MQKLYHKRSEYNPDGVVRRTVYIGGRQLCQLTGNPNGSWSFPIDWTGLEGMCVSQSLDTAQETIRALYEAFGHNPRYR